MTTYQVQQAKTRLSEVIERARTEGPKRSPVMVQNAQS